MVSVAAIAAVDFALGAAAVLGLLYLLYTETVVVHYPRFFRLITLGLLVYAATGPVVGTLAPAYIHLIHGLAGVFIAAGLWDLVHEDARRDEDFETIIALGGADTAEDASGAPAEDD